MSSHDEWQERRDREREERRQYEGDVYYDAWRRGLNPDRAVSCADDCYDRGRSAEQCVDGYAQEVRQERARREEAQALEARQLYEMEQAYYEQQQAEAEQQALPVATADGA